MIIADTNGSVYKWVIDRLKEPVYIKNSLTIGITREKKIVAGIIFSYYNTNQEVFMSLFSETPNFITRGDLNFVLYEIPFNFFKVRRVTTLASRKNKHARKFNDKLGFKLEGVIRKEHPNGDDIFHFGLLKQEVEQKWWFKKCQAAEEKEETLLHTA